MNIPNLPWQTALLRAGLLWSLLLGLSGALEARCAGAKCEQPSLLKTFVVAEVYTDSPQRYRALYQSRARLARLDIQLALGREDALRLISDRLSAMQSVYENRLSPYPGELTNEIVCGEPYRPTFEHRQVPGVELHIVRGFATSRLTFGACSDDLIAYQGFIVWYWCPARQALVQLEVMIPKGDPQAGSQLDRDLAALQCRR